MLDHATGGRFVPGMGAGWYVDEHHAFGIPLPPMGERWDRCEATVETIAALFSDAARIAPGVTRNGPYPLLGATNDPPPLRPGGPPIWLGVGGPRGIALAERLAQGWPMPGNRPGDVAYFAQVRDQIRRALDGVGRDPDEFTDAAQLSCGATPATRAEALATARAFVAAGANHVIPGLPASVAPEGLDAMVRKVAEPLTAGR